MSSVLIQRLLDNGYPLVGEHDIEELLAAPGVHVLFFTGDPQRNRESDDVAVVLPELVKAFAGYLQPAVVAREAQSALQSRYGFTRWPALVFARREGYLGAIAGMQNWGDYLVRIQTILAAEPGPAPGPPHPASGRMAACRQ